VRGERKEQTAVSPRTGEEDDKTHNTTYGEKEYRLGVQKDGGGRFYTSLIREEGKEAQFGRDRKGEVKRKKRAEIELNTSAVTGTCLNLHPVVESTSEDKLKSEALGY